MMRHAQTGLLFAAILLCGCEGGSGSGRIEVPECEQYFRVAEACFAKNPVAKATMADSVNQVKGMLAPSDQPLERAKMIHLCNERRAALVQGCK
jgi:hypothetical protein